MRNIIVEGMDGSGKDTLIEAMSKHPNFKNLPVHERASTSIGGPVDQLALWVERDAQAMLNTRAKPHIYNRHPLISEPIYAPFRSNRPLSPGFEKEGWLEGYRRIVGSQAVLVICQPPYHIVRNTLTMQGPDAHMPGVFYNALDIYMCYARLVWPGRTVRYNYTADGFESLARTITELMAD